MTTRWLLAVAMDWAVMFAALAVAYWNPWLLPVAMLVIGNRQHALGVLGHDAAHWPNQQIEDWGWLADVLCFLPATTSFWKYRDFHLEHHQKVGTPDDPELTLKRVTGQFSKPLKVWWHMGLLPSLNLIGAGFLDLLAFAWKVRPDPVRALHVGVVHLAIIGCLLRIGMWPVVVAWYLSFVTTFWFFFEIRVWFEHQQESRVTTRLRRPPAFARLLFFPHNVWAHDEHHKKPSIPFWELATTQADGETMSAVIAELKGISHEAPLGSRGDPHRGRTRHYFRP